MRQSAPPWYALLWRLLLPFALLRLRWRGRREPGYLSHIGERLGRYTRLPDAAPTIWVHAVSVGETRAAQPVVTALKSAYPAHRIVMTVMTAAGRATSETLYRDTVTRAWLPYDLAPFVDRFLDWCRPEFGLLMETELWPNAVLRSAARGVPMFLVNARMSEKSARGYARFGGLTREVLRALRGVAAQSPSDAQRLSALGAADVGVTGSVKFDVDVPAAAIAGGRTLRAMFGAARPVWVAGSTREGEEAIVLDALARQPMASDGLAVIVPRHPQRFDEVAELVRRRGIAMTRRSAGQPVPADTAVVIGDSMGEMLSYYSAADVAFIGGSLLPLGGQNLIEPLAVGTPVVIGPSSFNFSEVTREAVARGAAIQCADADATVMAIARLLDDGAARAQMRQAATTLLDEHRGATERTMRYVAQRLPKVTSASD